MSEQRRYSLSEIDAMRNAIRWSYSTGVAFYAEERTKEIEERIRTYMAADVDPQEIIDACMPGLRS